VDIEGRRLTERELRSLESAAPLGGFSPRRGAEAPIEGAVVAREGEGGGLFSYFRTRMTVGGGKGEGKDRPKG
jgi:hypothetical protein